VRNECSYGLSNRVEGKATATRDLEIAEPLRRRCGGMTCPGHNAQGHFTPASGRGWPRTTND
jgi:hypothetical protein